MLMQRLLAISAAAVAMATGASAQDAALEIRVIGEITPATPRVTIEIWAHFPAEDHALAGVYYDLRASGPAFSLAYCLIDCGPEHPVTFPERIEVVQGQIHFPPPIIADPANPIWVLEASWATDDLTPRVIDLWTETHRFDVFIDKDSTAITPRLDRLVEGAARIRVLDRACYVDCDASGELDFFDFLCFQNLFAAADPMADCDLSGGLDFFDFLCFQNAFAAGCP